MTDREMLLAAIRETPEEDTPRLAFADLLEEQGHDQHNQYFLDWATLIRVQVEAASVERYSPRWFVLARRQAELFEKRKAVWGPLSGSRLGGAAYRRGFREAIQFDPEHEEFPRHLDRDFASNPLRAICLQWYRKPAKATLAVIARHPGMARVATLDVSHNTPSRMSRLLEVVTPRMPRLRALGLGTLGLNARTAADLLGSLTVPGLAALDLSDNRLFSPAPLPEHRPESLFHSPTLAGVKWLDLFRTGLTPAAVHALAHSPVLRGLRYLNLGSGVIGENTLGSEGAEALAVGLSVRGLEYLTLSSQQLGPHGIAALVRTPFLATVRELDVTSNGIGDEGMIALAQCPHVAGLRKLNVERNGIGPAGVEALLASPYLAGLRILNLDFGGGEDVRTRLRERFPSHEPVMPGVHGPAFFEPLP